MNITAQDVEAIIAGGGVVYSGDGQEIGSVREIYLDPQTGEPTMARVSTGISVTSESLLPLQAATLDGHDLHVPYSLEQVKAAPATAAPGGFGTLEQERLYRHYGAPASGASDAPTLIRSEERLRVGMQPFVTERLKLRKYVVTEEVTVTVQVRHEEFRLERVPVDAVEGEPAGGGADALAEEDYEFILHAERPVVQTEVVPVERVLVRKDIISENQTISGQVRKEQIDADYLEGGRARPIE